MALLDEAGFTSVVATSCDQEYERYRAPATASPSRAASSRCRLRDHRPRRRPLRDHPPGVPDQDGELVGTMTFRILKFRPRPGRRRRRSGPNARPVITQDSQFWFEGIKHKLLIQKCSDCGDLRHPPGPMCHSCQSLRWEPIEASGRGRCTATW